MPKPLRSVLWLLPVIAGVLLLAPRVASAQEPETPSLTVRGQGTVSVRPDVALVTMGASVRRENAQAAFDAANAAVANLTAFLRAQGVAERDISTRQFSLSPEFGRPTGDQPPPLVAWRAVNTISVKLRDFTTIGGVIDGAVRTLGADALVSGISFTLEDTTAVAQQARDQAIANARERAQQIAASAGVRLIRILSISETSSPPPAPVPFAGGDVATAAPAAQRAEIAPGEQNITVTVEIVYEIG